MSILMRLEAVISSYIIPYALMRNAFFSPGMAAETWFAIMSEMP